MFRRFLLPRIVHLFYLGWSATWRKRVYEPDSLKTLISERKFALFAVWHGDEIALVSFSDRYRLATMVSTSKDGELMEFLLNKRNIKTSRGSSTRGGVRALVGLIKIMREGGRIGVMAVDGPAGPYHRAKPGVFELAKTLRCPVFPCGVSCSSKIVSRKSWNKTFVPKPFSKVGLYWGEPILPTDEAFDPRDSALALQLERALDAASQEAAKLIATP